MAKIGKSNQFGENRPELFLPLPTPGLLKITAMELSSRKKVGMVSLDDYQKQIFGEAHYWTTSDTRPRSMVDLWILPMACICTLILKIILIIIGLT